MVIPKKIREVKEVKEFRLKYVLCIFNRRVQISLLVNNGVCATGIALVGSSLY